MRMFLARSSCLSPARGPWSGRFLARGHHRSRPDARWTPTARAWHRPGRFIVDMRDNDDVAAGRRAAFWPARQPRSVIDFEDELSGPATAAGTRARRRPPPQSSATLDDRPAADPRDDTPGDVTARPVASALTTTQPCRSPWLRAQCASTNPITSARRADRAVLDPRLPPMVAEQGRFDDPSMGAAGHVSRMIPDVLGSCATSRLHMYHACHPAHLGVDQRGGRYPSSVTREAPIYPNQKNVPARFDNCRGPLAAPFTRSGDLVAALASSSPSRPSLVDALESAVTNLEHEHDRNSGSSPVTSAQCPPSVGEIEQPRLRPPGERSAERWCTAAQRLREPERRRRCSRRQAAQPRPRRQLPPAAAAARPVLT